MPNGELATAPWTERQPWRGLVGILVGVVVAFGISFAFDVNTYMSTVTLWGMSCAPPLFIMTIAWGGKFPAARLEQPWKGIALTGLLFILGTMVFMWNYKIVGGDILGPIAVSFAVLIVVTTLFFLVAFWCWPFNRFSLPVMGILFLIAAFLVSMAIFRLYNFSTLPPPLGGGTGIDPGGPFKWDSATVFSLEVVTGLFYLMLFDFWPLTKVKSLMRQPLFGIVAFIVALVIGIATHAVAIWGMDFGAMEWLGKYCLAFGFGVLAVTLFWEHWPGARFTQPLKGVVNAATAGILGLICFFVYRALCYWQTGFNAIPGGEEQMYAWIATALLGLTFIIFGVYVSFFDSWPLPPRRPAPGPPPPGSK